MGERQAGDDRGERKVYREGEEKEEGWRGDWKG
jgi:hypothetical protein